MPTSLVRGERPRQLLARYMGLKKEWSRETYYRMVIEGIRTFWHFLVCRFRGVRVGCGSKRMKRQLVLVCLQPHLITNRSTICQSSRTERICTEITYAQAAVGDLLGTTEARSDFDCGRRRKTAIYRLTCTDLIYLIWQDPLIHSHLALA